jgi:hypothetical protein
MRLILSSPPSTASRQRLVWYRYGAGKEGGALFDEPSRYHKFRDAFIGSWRFRL